MLLSQWMNRTTQWLLAYCYSQPPGTTGWSNIGLCKLVSTWMGDCISMSISVDSPSDETLNRGPLALLLWRQYKFPFGINIVKFSIFFQFQFCTYDNNSCNSHVSDVLPAVRELYCQPLLSLLQLMFNFHLSLQTFKYFTTENKMIRDQFWVNHIFRARARVDPMSKWGALCLS